jgi:hypothetical protein
MENNKPKKEEIVVLAFKKDSQTRVDGIENSSYRFVESAIDLMLAEFNVRSEKLALAGCRKDIYNYISSLIDVYIKIYNVNIERMEDFDPVDFDPDIEEGEAF